MKQYRIIRIPDKESSSGWKYFVQRFRHPMLFGLIPGKWKTIFWHYGLSFCEERVKALQDADTFNAMPKKPEVVKVYV